MDSTTRASCGDQTPGTDDGRGRPFLASVNRRRFLQLGGAAAGAFALAGTGGAVGATRAMASSLPAGATGTISDLKHVVILMQENRSFDHFFGSLQGVRGFGDKQAFRFQSGNSIFQQPDPGRTDGGYLLPWRMNSTTMNAMNAGDLDHSWSGDHSARNAGLWNNWVSAKGEQSMGYLTRADLPFNYALADAFTICDGYHQAIMGPTSPNRMYFWTGTSSGTTTNPADYRVKFNGVTTYPEQLTAAGSPGGMRAAGRRHLPEAALDVGKWPHVHIHLTGLRRALSFVGQPARVGRDGAVALLERRVDQHLRRRLNAARIEPKHVHPPREGVEHHS